MKNISFFWLIFALNACGADTSPGSLDPPETVEPAPVCATYTDALTGVMGEVKGNFEIILNKTYYSLVDNFVLFYLSIKASNKPGCQAIHFTDLPFELSGSSLPTFERWELYGLTANERGTLARGIIDSPIFNTNAMISVKAGEEKFYALGIFLNTHLPRQGFTVTLKGPIVWHTPNDLEDRHTVLDIPLSAQFNM